MSKVSCRPANGPTRTAPRNIPPKWCCRISAANSPCWMARMAARAAPAVAPAKPRPASSATNWMTRYLSKLVFTSLLLIVGGCAASSGLPATAILEPEIAAAYMPLHARVHLGIDTADGAAMVIAPGIAVTNAHNANLLEPKSVIGVRQDYDLLFFRTPRNASPQTAAPVIGESVTAYGQGGKRELRVAQGVVKEIRQCPGCTAPAYFVFAGNAG